MDTPAPTISPDAQQSFPRPMNRLAKVSHHTIKPPFFISTPLQRHVLTYRGTKESVFCSVVGSSSKREAMSLPWGTATSRYLIFSPVFLRLARPLPPCTRERGFNPGVGRPPRRAQPPCAHGIGGDTQRLRSEQKLSLGCRAEPRSAETHEGLQEHKRGTMHLSYEATPSPYITNSKQKNPLKVQISLLPALPRGLGIQHALGPLQEISAGSSRKRDIGMLLYSAGMLCWAAAQPPAAASAPSGTRRHGTGTVPAAGSVLGHFPAFKQSLRDGVISGSGSSISASDAAHSSPWALLWAQPRLLYNLGFPEKLKREMKDSYQSSHSVPPKP